MGTSRLAWTGAVGTRRNLDPGPPGRPLGLAGVSSSYGWDTQPAQRQHRICPAVPAKASSTRPDGSHVALVLAHETGHRTGARTSSAMVRHRPGRQDHPAACRSREDRLRAQDAGDRRGSCCVGGRRGVSATVLGEAPVLPAAEGCLSRCEPLAGAPSVGEGREARGPGAEAGKGLALAQAEIRLGPHGPTAQGALRARRLGGSPDRG